ncbi:HK97 gp10 family phage protein [Halorubrum rutilum]|uniref:HK97 gp10 family phage protein n=1 Tax=Halorubrum rutilum TaxID=1364933 RepID=A0ABD6AH76_9EURY|nr:HK97 gp10 family phage protein [Halorubrum rutilum]
MRIDGFEESADDFAEFAEGLREFADGMDDAVDEGTRETVKQIERTAKRLVAVDSGTLRWSIAFRRIDLAEYIIGTPVDYAPDVEFGSAPHVITPTTGEFLYFEGEDGHLIRKRSVQHPGTPAQPFMRPALREHRSDLARNIQAEIDALAKKAFS